MLVLVPADDITAVLLDDAPLGSWRRPTTLAIPCSARLVANGV